MTEKQKLRTLYVAVDYVSTLAGLAVFSFVRYLVVPGLVERFGSAIAFFGTVGVRLTMAVCPLFMLLLYYLTGYYVRVTAKSRVNEFLKTAVAVAIASLVFFLVVLLNDVLPRRRYNYEMILLFFSVMLPIVYVPRVLLTSILKWRARGRGPRSFLLVSSGPVDDRVIDTCNATGREYGFRIGAVYDIGREEDRGESVESVMSRLGLRGAMLLPGAIDSGKVMGLLSKLFPLSVPVMLSPDEREIVTGRVKFDTVTAEPLTDLTDPHLPDSFVAVKRMMDIIVSGVALVVLSPVLVSLALAVRIMSGGPVFYSQERIGYHGHPFRIHKFRSMITDSEPGGQPMLSGGGNDPRVTPLGRWMRKYRLDELPNLWNVLKGDMSLVGPRPERRYYIDLISVRAPHCALLHLVRPGLTSWGMVKYGYASDVDAMVERLKYDILYIQNLSMSVDLRILLHTVRTVVRGEGK